MKRAYSLCLGACALLAMLVMPVQALSMGSSRAQVPFAFLAAGKSMPAGEYRIVRNEGSGLVTLSDVKGRSIFLMGRPTTTATPVAKGRLVFDRSGDGYTLAEVWTSGSTQGSAFKAAPAKPVLVALN